MMNLIFSMNGPRLTDEQASSFVAFAQWVILNERDGRLLVDGIGRAEDVSGVIGALHSMGRDPVAIGAWLPNGAPAAGFPLNVGEWLAVAPDVVDLADPENPVATRPTEFAEIHRWAGWAEKQVTA